MEIVSTQPASGGSHERRSSRQMWRAKERKWKTDHGDTDISGVSKERPVVSEGI